MSRLKVMLLGFCFLAMSCAPTGTITLSRNRVVDRGGVILTGTAFPPKAIVYTHLRRPDGTEFPALRFLTDEKGEFTHKIETFTLQEGTHQVWVEQSGKSSKVLTFQVQDESSRH